MDPSPTPTATTAPSRTPGTVAAMRSKIEEKREVNFKLYSRYVDASADGIGAADIAVGEVSGGIG